MGGLGSTRWGDHPRKITVDECLAVDIQKLIKCSVVRPNWQGELRWHYVGGSRGGQDCGHAVGYQALGDPLKWLILRYQVNDSDPIELWVPLETTIPPVGGMRWWMRCPLSVNGQVCRRRVRALYLPNGGQYFGCRHCYRLAYQSQREYVPEVPFWARPLPRWCERELARIERRKAAQQGQD